MQETEQSEYEQRPAGDDLTKRDSIAYQYISEQAQADALTEKLRGAGQAGMDIEADSFHHYFPKVCLIQLSFGKVNAIVDPLAGADLSGLMDVLSEKELVLHDAGYDLRMLKKDFGFVPKGQIYDTMLAGRLLGLKRLGLEGMLADVLGVQINKVSQRADWSARPLREDLLSYAATDTHHLPMLWGVLEGKLRQLGRLDWHRESCQRAVCAAMENPKDADSDTQWRIKGSRDLSDRELEFLKVLWYWRDKEARKSDVPAFRVIGSEQLLSIAIKAQSQEQFSIEGLGRLPRNLRGSRLRAFLNVLEHARASQAGSWPGQLRAERTRRPDMRISQRFEQLKRRCRAIAERLGLQPEVVASRAAMGRIAAGPNGDLAGLVEEGLVMRWQAQLLAEAVSEVFDSN